MCGNKWMDGAVRASFHDFLRQFQISQSISDQINFQSHLILVKHIMFIKTNCLTVF